MPEELILYLNNAIYPFGGAYAAIFAITFLHIALRVPYNLFLKKKLYPEDAFVSQPLLYPTKIGRERFKQYVPYDFIVSIIYFILIIILIVPGFGVFGRNTLIGSSTPSAELTIAFRNLILIMLIAPITLLLENFLVIFIYRKKVASQEAKGALRRWNGDLNEVYKKIASNSAMNQRIRFLAKRLDQILIPQIGINSRALVRNNANAFLLPAFYFWGRTSNLTLIENIYRSFPKKQLTQEEENLVFENIMDFTYKSTIFLKQANRKLVLEFIYFYALQKISQRDEILNPQESKIPSLDEIKEIDQ